MAPRFSVIIPTYNDAGYILQSIESVLNQTYCDYEIIVVDDGSTDDTKKLLEPYINDEKIKYIYQKNKGLASARNTGISYSQGRYIALLDADDMWLPEKLAVQQYYIEREPGLAMLCSNTYKFYGDDIEKIEVGHKELTKKDLNSRELLKLILTKENPVVCPTLVISRRVLDEIGFYDENLSYLGCEDRDMSIRIISRYKTRYINKCLALYRIRKEGMHSDINKMSKARRYVLEKTYRTLNNIKQIKKLKNRAYANIYYYEAEGNFEEKNIKITLKKLMYAFNCHVFDMRQVKLLVKCVSLLFFKKHLSNY